MNTLIASLNVWGTRFAGFALPMLLQSSVLIALVFALDLALRKRVRAVIRYAVWMLALVKLALPPSLALPTGAAYWLPTQTTGNYSALPPGPVPVSKADAALLDEFRKPTSSLDKFLNPGFKPAVAIQGGVHLKASSPGLTWPTILFVVWLAVALGVGMWVVWRLRLVIGVIRRSIEAPEAVRASLESCRRQMGIKRRIRVRCAAIGSPAICGVLRPIILLPPGLAENLSEPEMRSILLHELAHLKRGDLWVNHAQILLQIAYWYNPLLWLANARIRRTREQAVDEMVLVEMGAEAQTYPTTLLHVAKLGLGRPVAALGLMGILEPGRGLSQRILHIMNRPLPRTARIGARGLAAVLLLALVALPMACRNKTGAAPKPTALESARSVGEVMKDEIVLTISKEGAITLQHETITLDALQEKLAEATQRNPRTTLVIKADHLATWSTVHRVLDAAEATHITGINLTSTLDTAAPSGARTARNKLAADGPGADLGNAVVRGDSGALETLTELARSEYASFARNSAGLADHSQDKLSRRTFAPLNAAFSVIADAAAGGNHVAIDTIWRAAQIQELKGLAVQSLGTLAGVGSEAALEALVNPRKYGFLLASTVGALKPAADQGNQKAIDALAAVARDAHSAGLWFMTADGLRKSAAAGNAVAIDALISMLGSSNRAGKYALSCLQTAADNGNQKAIDALASFASRAPEPAAQPMPPQPSQNTAESDETDNIAWEFGMAVVRGDPGALDKLTEFVKARRASLKASVANLSQDERINMNREVFAPINVAFSVIADAAVSGNSNAVEAVWRSARDQELRALTVRCLGAMAGAGNEAAVEALVHPQKYGFILSRTVGALKPAADHGNQKAIDALAAVARDAHHSALWFITAQSLQKPAEAGNAVAINALINILASTNENLRSAALPPLQTAAANHNAQAAEALRAMGLEWPPRPPFK